MKRLNLNLLSESSRVEAFSFYHTSLAPERGIVFASAESKFIVRVSGHTWFLPVHVGSAESAHILSIASIQTLCREMQRGEVQLLKTYFYYFSAHVLLSYCLWRNLHIFDQMMGFSPLGTL